MGDELARVGWNWARGAPGPTWALIRSETGEVVGFGGGVEQRRGDWELWCVLAPLAWRDWPSAVQCARWWRGAWASAVTGARPISPAT